LLDFFALAMNICALHHFIHLNRMSWDLELDAEIHVRIQNDIVNGFAVSTEKYIQLLADGFKIHLSLLQLLVIL
jgi:hypothetical protein